MGVLHYVEMTVKTLFTQASVRLLILSDGTNDLESVVKEGLFRTTDRQGLMVQPAAVPTMHCSVMFITSTCFSTFSL